jgi:hypothetical protein
MLSCLVGLHQHLLVWQTLQCALSCDATHPAQLAQPLATALLKSMPKPHEHIHYSAFVSCCNASSFLQAAVLQWLQQQRPPCTYDESAVAAAVAGGHVSVLQLLRECEGPNSLLLLRTSSADCTAAAAGGHLQVCHQQRDCLVLSLCLAINGRHSTVACAQIASLVVLSAVRVLCLSQPLQHQMQPANASTTSWIHM